MGPFVHDIYFETHDFKAAVAFWTSLGWTVGHDFEVAGSVHAPGGGPYFFIEQVEPDAPLLSGIYFEVPDDFVLPEGTEGWEETAWGSKIARFTDPDGRQFWFQTPSTEG